MADDIGQLFDQAQAAVAGVGIVLNQLDVGNIPRREMWEEDIKRLRSEQLPKTIIAVCGETGAGKSSLLNALLDGAHLPASGHQSCTATVVEVSYHAKNVVEGEVVFMNRQQWENEVTLALQDARVSGDDSDEEIDELDDESPAGIARAKIEAVYPGVDIQQTCVDDLMNQHSSVLDLLGHSLPLSAQTPSAFSDLLCQYIRSGEDEQALWPLVERVRVKCNASVLSSGAVLVDLPGWGDSNAARAAVADEYLRKCSFLWIAAPIIRAVSNKTARDLLGRRFQLQLTLDGNYNTDMITFIATKTDDIDPEETVRDLKLRKDPEYLAIKKDIKGCLDAIEERRGKKEKSLSNCARLQEVIATAKRHLDEHNASTASLKRRGDHAAEVSSPKRVKLEQDPWAGHSTCPSAHPDPTLDARDVPAEDRRAVEIQVLLSDLEKQLSETSQAANQHGEVERNLERSYQEKQARLLNFAKWSRSNRTIQILQRDFREGSREFNGRPTASQASQARRDLPVFPCSSREYMAIKGIRLDESDTSNSVPLTSEADTGIPALQNWCHTLTAPGRRCSLDALTREALSLIGSVQSYLTEAVQTSTVSTSISEACKGIAMRLIKSFEEITIKFDQQLVADFSNGLEDSLRKGVEKATQSATEITTLFAFKQHWNTFRAALRREGVFRDRDLNVELVQPMMLEILHSWLELFRLKVLDDFRQWILRSLDAQLEKILELAAHNLFQRRVGMIVGRCREEAHTALGSAIEQVRATMTEEQKKSSRLVAPHIQKQLKGTYDDAKVIRGPGSVATQRSLLIQHVEQDNEDWFNEAADILMTSLEVPTKVAAKDLQTSMERLAKKIEFSLADIWTSPPDTTGHERARSRLKVTAIEVQTMVANLSLSD